MPDHPVPDPPVRDLPPLLILRHGETAWNREGRMQGDRDSPLTDLGRVQAAAMGRALGTLGVGPATHAALTSPQGRARATAALALAPLGFEARPEALLREVSVGAWAGLPLADIAARWPGPEDEPLLAFYDRAPGGEGIAALAARASRLLAALDRPTILVTHGITQRVLCALALGLAPEAGEALALRQGTLAKVEGARLQVIAAPGSAGSRPAP